MKHSVQYAHLRVHHETAQEATVVGRIFTQKTVDIALMIVSLAGLLSAMAFLATIS